jgi:hypothetical protein
MSFLTRTVLFAAAFLALAPSAPAARPFVAGASAASNPFCVAATSSTPGVVGYTLTLTFPTTGYHLTLLGTTVVNGTVTVRVRYTVDPGLQGQIVTTQSLRFAQLAPNFPVKFVVIANGQSLGPATPIQLPTYMSPG